MSRLSDIKDRVGKLLNDIYLGEITYNRVANKLINGLKVFIISSRKFMIDDCFTKASSIAYTTIVSLIPTLTVALTFYSIFSGVGDKKEELFRKITLFMVDHNIKINIDPILEAILSLIENAGKIGGVGAIVMIFTATAVLRTLENSLNDIWNIKKSRPFFIKIIYYWTALTLGPIILISGTTVATQIFTAFSPPNYNSAYISNDDKLWVVGSKGEILYSENNNFKFKSLPLNKIDFDNQRIYDFNYRIKEFKEHKFRFEEMELKKCEFNDIQFVGDHGWIVGDDGIVIHTADSGKSWGISKVGSFDFNDIHMIDQKYGFIAADNGYLLKTIDRGKSWEVLEWKKLSANLNSISFLKNNGIITAERGIILTTNDRGITWKIRHVDEAKKKKRYISLNSSFQISEKDVFLVGEEGTILYSNNGGGSWENRKFLNKNYNSVYFIDRNKGYVAGGEGIFIYTENAGIRWHKMSLSTSDINRLIYEDNNIWAIGKIGMIMSSTDNGKIWNGVEGKSFIAFILNFFAPFIFIWLLFLLTYLVLPNTKIPFKPASIGAAFTSTVWVVFILLFIVYVRSFAKGTFAIYGALAAIPLFLLLVYASSVIILYGAEVSSTLMHPRLDISIKGVNSYKKDIHLYYGVSILYHIYRKFEKGEGFTAYNELVTKISNLSEEVDYFIGLFKRENLIVEIEDECLLPANSSKNIYLSSIINMLHDVNLFVPGLDSSSGSLECYIGEIFSNIKKSNIEIIGHITLCKMIEEIG